MYIIIFAFFTVSFGIIGTVFMKRENFYEERIRKFLPQQASADDSSSEGELENKKNRIHFRMLISLVGKQFQGKTFINKWQSRIDEAALPLKAEEFFALRLMIATGMFILGLLLGYQSFVILIVLSIVGYGLPSIYIKNRKNKRLVRCASQLPPTLGTMATAMKAGFSFLQAMQLIGKEIPDPIGPEFNRTLREINLGVPFEEAFHHLLERLPNDDLEIIVTALLVQRSTGGNLADILESIQETIRERIRIKEELKTLTAQGRMSAWIISLLPLGLGLILNMMNPEYFAPMLHHPLGWLLIGIGVISGFIGWMFIQKIVSIEV